MLKKPSPSPDNTFVIRFWREWTANQGRWRGRIEHVQSGQRLDFVRLDDVIEFLRRFKVAPPDEAP